MSNRSALGVSSARFSAAAKNGMTSASGRSITVCATSR